MVSIDYYSLFFLLLNKLFKVCVKANSKPEWVRWPEGDKEIYEDYGTHSIEDWHKTNNEYVK